MESTINIKATFHQVSQIAKQDHQHISFKFWEVALSKSGEWFVKAVIRHPNECAKLFKRKFYDLNSVMALDQKCSAALN